MRKFIILLSLTLCAICLPACTKIDPPKTPVGVEPLTKVDDTLIMFFPWSGNLTSYFKTNIEDIKSAVSRGILKNERILICFASTSNYASIFELTFNGEGNPTTTYLHKEYNDFDFTSEEGLIELFSDAVKFSPSSSYSLMIGCHGMGWIPVAEPSSSTSQRIPSPVADKLHYNVEGATQTRYYGGTTAEYQTNIETLASALESCNLTLEYILFDDCYMGNMEVAYDLRHATRHIIACPTEVMATGYPYDIIGDDLIGKGVDYEAICDKFYNFYNTNIYPYATIAAIDCSQIDAMAEIMAEINASHTIDAEKISEIQVMDGYKPTIFFDFGDYVAKMNPEQELLDKFNAQLELLVPHKAHTKKFPTNASGSFKTIDVKAYSGITISDPSSNSKTSGVKQETNWYKATHRN